MNIPSGVIQSEHPNLSTSVKTRAAIRKLLNYSKNTVRVRSESPARISQFPSSLRFIT